MKSGQIGQGVALVDEAMLSAASGELSPVVTGLIYCIVIASCHEAFQLDRAREWTLAMTEWCDAQPQLVAFSGTCLAHRSEILQLNGDWDGALIQARGACKRILRGRDREANAAGYYQQAEIHRLRGAFDAAESDYQKASELGREPQPGLALLRLAQGRADDAASAIRRALAATADRTQRTALLPASVEVMLAAGDIEGAGAAAQELEDIAQDFDAEIVAAMAAHARGAVELASGNAAAALPLLRSAIAAWQQVAAPYLVARLRGLVGLACRALGRRGGRGAGVQGGARHVRRAWRRSRCRPHRRARGRRAGRRFHGIERPGIAGAAHGGGGQDEQGDRGRAVHQRKDGRPPRQQYFRQARRAVAVGGDGLRLQARACLSGGC